MCIITTNIEVEVLVYLFITKTMYKNLIIYVLNVKYSLYIVGTIDIEIGIYIQFVEVIIIYLILRVFTNLLGNLNKTQHSRRIEFIICFTEDFKIIISKFKEYQLWVDLK